jgi:hypothetical protein
MNILVERLDEATDLAATFAMQRGLPLAISKKSILIGSLVIEKNSKGFYDIIQADRNKLYEDISVFDVAVIIAQRYNSGERSVIKEVLDLERKFVKYHTDMIHYLHCMKSAKKKNPERLAILEDKFQVAELYAKDIKDQLALFKRMK